MPSSTSASRPLLRLCLLALCVAALTAVSASAALGKGRIDRSFGDDGSVDIGAHLTKDHFLGALAVVPGGPIYFSEGRIGACHDGCLYDERLRRLDSDGGFEAGYSAPAIANTEEGTISLTVDSRRRLLISWEAPGRRDFIRRLHPDGSLDRSFGKGGTVELPCRCRLGELELTPDDGLLVSLSREAGSFERFVGITIVLELRPDGALLRRFGRGGVVRLRQPWKAGGSALLTGDGSVLLDGSYCCAESGPEYDWIGRLSPRGRPEERFAAEASHSLRSLFAEKESLWEYSYLLPRGRGSVLFATGFEGSVLAALRVDGRLDRSFGHGGLAKLPLQSSEAVGDGAGGFWVVGAGESGFQVRRETARGRPDSSFGKLRLRLGSEYGLYVYPDGKGRAIVVSPDESVCREECPSDPSMVRVAG